MAEGSSANFSVQVSNADPLTYQWQKNTLNIPAANGATYTLTPASMSDKGAGFRCILTNALGTRTSTVALLTVTPDATPPTVSKILNVGTTLVVINFSEPVEAATANVASNYTLDHGVSVTSAAIASDTRTVQLTTTPLVLGISYTVTIKNVRDRAGALEGVSVFTFAPPMKCGRVQTRWLEPW